MNNNIEMVKNHLEYNGYEIQKNKSAKDSSFIGINKTYGLLFLRPIGENGCNGVRLEKYYSVNLKDCINSKKLSLFEMVNEMNKKLIFGTVFLYENKGMIMTSGFLGDYNKTTFSTFG